jgi:hypothetical protein
MQRRRQAMESNCKKEIEGVGYKHLLLMEGTLAEYVNVKHAEEAAFLRKSLEGLC